VSLRSEAEEAVLVMVFRSGLGLGICLRWLLLLRICALRFVLVFPRYRILQIGDKAVERIMNLLKEGYAATTRGRLLLLGVLRFGSQMLWSLPDLQACRPHRVPDDDRHSRPIVTGRSSPLFCHQRNVDPCHQSCRGLPPRLLVHDSPRMPNLRRGETFC